MELKADQKDWLLQNYKGKNKVQEYSFFSFSFLWASAGAEGVFGVHQGTFGFGFELCELSKRHRCL